MTAQHNGLSVVSAPDLDITADVEQPGEPLDFLELLAKTLNSDDLAWQEQALCAQADPEAWFPEKGGTARPAKAICVNCEVREECLQYALDNDERFGVWGGVSERDRRKMSHELAADAA